MSAAMTHISISFIAKPALIARASRSIIMAHQLKEAFDHAQRKEDHYSGEYEEKIAEVEKELADLTAKAKAKKVELKKLVKAKEQALKVAAEKKAAEDKEKLMKAVADSGKTVEEVLELLKKK